MKMATFWEPGFNWLDFQSDPCQRSEKKGQRQKVDFFFMKCER